MSFEPEILSEKKGRKVRKSPPDFVSRMRAYRGQIAKQEEVIKLLLKKESLIMEETFDIEGKETLAKRVQKIILSPLRNTASHTKDGRQAA
jgi:hypothetical protein